MPEMLTPTSALAGAGLVQDVALITDGRFSGGSHGFLIGHVVPKPLKAAIALVQTGDQITIDSQKGEINMDVSAEELEKRRAAWTPPPYKANRGTLYKYIKNVQNGFGGMRHRRVGAKIFRPSFSPQYNFSPSALTHHFPQAL